MNNEKLNCCPKHNCIRMKCKLIHLSVLVFVIMICFQRANAQNPIITHLGEVQLHQGDNSIRINTHQNVNLKVDYVILEPVTFK